VPRPLPFTLLVITDWSIPSMLQKVEAALAATSLIAVQHRHPEATDRQFFEEARAIAQVCRRRGSPLFINRRLDVALALALDAHLHLPAHGVRVQEVLPFLGERLLSVAVHGAEEAQRGADLALVSPVFAPFSKPADRRVPLGPEGFFEIARGLDCPAFALGGIDAARARTLGEAAGLAVISAVLDAADPARAARDLVGPRGPRCGTSSPP
jgi:thiamine-phosphate pyrophosphorylase